MKKDLAIIGGLVIFIIVLLIFGGGFTSLNFGKSNSSGSDSSSASIIQSANNLIEVSIGSLMVNAEIASTSAQQQKGLSSRDSIAIANGMLFVFDTPQNYTFWMKDMKFAIDIIWMDDNKNVVYVVKNAPPEPGKNDNELTRYQSPNVNTKAKYVLEINAGLCDLHNIQVGDTASF